MGMFDHFLRDVRQILFPNAEQNAVPSMDGAFSPNDRLDGALPIGEPLPGVDDIAATADGATLYVSAGKQVFRLSGPGFADRTVIAAFEGDAGGLALHPDGRLLVCVAGKGLAALVPDAGADAAQWLTSAGGQALAALTAVTVAPDGAVFASVGSRHNAVAQWLRDLMEKGSSGFIVGCGADLGSAAIVADGLAFPYGLAPSPDGGSLWFSESWAHRVSRAPIEPGGRLGVAAPVMCNLPGYPARLEPDAEGGFLLALIGVRTHLIEFVLREDEYRAEMLRTIPERYWIGPALSGGHDCLEPMQIGSVKALGIQKPWAPPRSYGLLARIDGEGEVIESLHSRAGGSFHGITAACETPAGLVVAAKGSGRLVLVEETAP